MRIHSEFTEHGERSKREKEKKKIKEKVFFSDLSRSCCRLFSRIMIFVYHCGGISHEDFPPTIEDVISSTYCSRTTRYNEL